jgi:hypothetical protein
MKRRLLLTLPMWLPLGLGAATQPSYKVSIEQMQQALAQRFPRRYPLAGLLDLNVQAPRLRLLPEQNRLGTEMVVQAAGPALRRSYTRTSCTSIRCALPTCRRARPNCSMPTGRRWPSRRCRKSCCTRCARKTWHWPM